MLSFFLFLCNASRIHIEGDPGTVAYNNWKHNCSEIEEKPANVMNVIYMIMILFVIQIHRKDGT